MINKNRHWFIAVSAAVGVALALPGVLAAGGKTRAELSEYAVVSGTMALPYVPRRGYSDGPYGQVHFRDTGEGQPVVLLAQAPMSSRQFTNVYEPLHRRGFRAIGIDSPGFGESDPTPFVPTVQDWAMVVPAVLDHLGIAQADVVGHHTGALIATEVSLQFPGRVRRLVLNGPSPKALDFDLVAGKANEARSVNFVYEHDGSHLAESFMVRYRMYGEGADPETITRYIVEKFQGYAPFWTGHHASSMYDHRVALKKVTHPTLILVNTGDIIHDRVQLARKIRPDFAYVELEGGGEADIVDQMPEEWADAVAAFLKR